MNVAVPPEPARRLWRCSRCRTLLGVVEDGSIHLKYKAARYVVEGHVVAVCRRCSEANDIRVSENPQMRGRAASAPQAKTQ